MIPTMAELWLDYLEHCIPHQADAIQVQETRRAFYAGAMSLFQAIQLGESELDEDDALRQRIGYHDELMTWARIMEAEMRRTLHREGCPHA